MTPLEAADIQGIVLYGYGSLPRARYVHISWAAEGSRPSTWLAELAPEIHDSARGKRIAQERINVAFTYQGIGRFRLSAKELGTFPRELQQGMSDPLRAHVLGDVGENDPKTWEFGGPDHAIDALLMLYAPTEAAVDAMRERLVARIVALGGVVVHEDVAELRNPVHEPFGFRDGIVQPHVAGSPRLRKGDYDVEVPAGEFVLGYPNAYGELPASPHGDDRFDIGKNGSYLVYRKLRQDTPAFWQCMLERALPSGDPREATKLASKMIGRWPSGAPIVRYPDFDPGPGSENETFDLDAEDPDGQKCPIGAHVRRANPRNMLPPDPEESRKEVERHRLLRRGRPYGPRATGTPRERAQPDGEERGLVFMALNVSFRRQFEFVQQTWINNPKFAGLFDERDPVVASVIDEGGQTFSMPGEPARRRVAGLPRFVTTRGGAYFFVPGLRALSWLAARNARSA